jgi:hypothetical protein
LTREQEETGGEGDDDYRRKVNMNCGSREEETLVFN